MGIPIHGAERDIKSLAPVRINTNLIYTQIYFNNCCIEDDFNPDLKQTFQWMSDGENQGKSDGKKALLGNTVNSVRSEHISVDWEVNASRVTSKDIHSKEVYLAIKDHILKHVNIPDKNILKPSM